MKKLATAAIALLVLAPAASGALWLRTAADTGQEIQALYSGVSAARCFPFSSPQQQRTYHATSQVMSNGTRDWNAFFCVVFFAGSDYCTAVAYITGEHYGALRLGTYPEHGCTPYRLHRVVAGTGPTT